MPTATRLLLDEVFDERRHEAAEGRRLSTARRRDAETLSLMF